MLEETTAGHAVRLGKDGTEATHGEEGDSASPQLPREGRLPLIEMEVPPQLWSPEHDSFLTLSWSGGANGDRV